MISFAEGIAARFRLKLLKEASDEVKTHSLQNAWKREDHSFVYLHS